MRKGILIINMPDNCASCKFLDDRYDYPSCIVTGETRGYNFDIHNNKMDKCPLIMITGEDKEYEDGYADGWNACRRNFLSKIGIE